MKKIIGILLLIFNAVFYIWFSDILNKNLDLQINGLLPSFLSEAIKGIIWLSINFFIFSLSRHSPWQSIKKGWMAAALTGFFVYFWTYGFLSGQNTEIVRFGIAEAWWIAYILLELSLFISDYGQKPVILDDFSKQMGLYVLWLIFSFFITVPMFFLGKNALFVGPLLMVILIIASEFKKRKNAIIR